jgi:uncharacterized protein DUF6789
MKRQRVLIGRGLFAGLAATIVLSLVIALKQALGVLPQLSTISVLAQMLGYQSLAVGWILHFFVGVILWGPLYAWIDPKSSFPHWFNGIMFASCVWLGLMLFIMPVVGAGLFGLQLGLVTPTATLALHWIYGTVLGSVFGSSKLSVTPLATRDSSPVTI